MFQFIPVHEENTYAMRVSGKITHEDYQKLLPELEGLIEENKKISLLIEFDDFKGADFAAMKDDFNFGRKHNNDFEKLAVVGDKKWLKWMTFLTSPFIKGGLKYFERPALQDAWDWLREKEPSIDELADAPIDPYKKIMVGVDFSPFSKHAAKRAIELSNQADVELVLVNVVNENVLYDVYSGPIGLGLSLGALSQDTINILDTSIASYVNKSEDQMKELITELGLNQTQGVVLTGRPSTTLNSYAEAQNIDLIVMGTQSRRGMEAIMDSSTRYLLGHSRCEVLSVPLFDR
ncbi:MAG: nucleotide-binding universal stress UspA family protein [Cocleimonas sp.]|jgi:nucleotide-binding universal stress UspA family protein